MQVTNHGTKGPGNVRRKLAWWARRLWPRRAIVGVLRRIQVLPDRVAWNRFSGPGSSNYRKIVSFRNVHAGGRCFIIGNGPSLNQMDLSPLAQEITFGLNRIFLIFDRIGFQPTYYVSIGEDMVVQSVEGILKVEGPKFINWRARHVFPDRPDLIYLLQRLDSNFVTDLTRGIWLGYSVTFAALELAFYMGFEEAILIGVDHNFKLPGNPYEKHTATGAGEDHFDPNYFPPGFTWRMPDMRNSEYAFEIARRVYEEHGRRVLDATLGGQLKVFPKVDYQSVVRREDRKPKGPIA